MGYTTRTLAIDKTSGRPRYEKTASAMSYGNVASDAPGSDSCARSSSSPLLCEVVGGRGMAHRGTDWVWDVNPVAIIDAVIDEGDGSNVRGGSRGLVVCVIFNVVVVDVVVANRT